MNQALTAKPGSGQATPAASAAPAYDESAIRVLKGLDPVRQLPGMYTRTESPLHIVQEVIDNAADEALGGYCDRVSVTLVSEDTIRIADNGRGIPTGLHPIEKVPVVELVFTQLHAGGKFDKAAAGAYKFSGGLHGVGVSVTNALSSMLRVEVVRDGRSHSLEFADGYVSQPLKRGEPADGHGTTVTVRPNPKYFGTPTVPVAGLRDLLRSKAVLLQGVTFELIDARKEGEPTVERFVYANGMADYLAEAAGEPAIVPLLSGAIHVEPGDANSGDFAEGEGATWCLSWFERGDGSGRSFVNLIPTPSHGTHVAGLRSAVFNAVRNYIDHHSLLPKGLKLSADDAFRSTRFVLSAKLLQPIFQGQTKDRLDSREGLKLIERMVQPSIEGWFNHNPVHARTVADLALAAAAARQRAAKPVDRRKSSSVVMLPGKLTDCESTDLAVNELFLVEGDSAGGSAKQGRNKESQAILPLRGKVLNTWETDRAKSLQNTEVHDMSVAFGIPLHTLDEEVDFSKLRYGKVCILSDADVDGSHIQVLLLTMFLKHFPQLVARGHIYVARPPLYRLDAEAGGSGSKKRQAKKIYAMDEAELAGWRERFLGEGYPAAALQVGRFKGLGEMNAEQLWETTLCPDTRRLTQVRLPEALRDEAAAMFDNLMAKTSSGWRREWMERRGDEVEAE